MGVFSRLRDIVSSNINAMLDKAEDPEKLIKLMIQEMEDTLVEIKASCAGTLATQKRIRRDLEAAREAVDLWAGRAELAVARGRDDMAREAIQERRDQEQKVAVLEKELGDCETLVTQQRRDIERLEKKLETAREKHRVLVRRHMHATRKQRAETQMRQVDTSDAWVRFEQFARRVDRMESEADLVNAGRAEKRDAFDDLGGDEDVERELEALHRKVRGGTAADRHAASS